MGTSINLAKELAAPLANQELGEIETQMRIKLNKLKGSNYPDSFDWSMYDRLRQKFDEPPRGGVVFKTTFRLANHHSSCNKCHYSFEIDSYGRGCFHECTYCYAKDQLTSHGSWNRPQPFPVDLAEVRKVFYTVFETNKSSKWRSVMEKRTPLRIGSMSDSFMYLDSRYGVTKELLKILKFYEYPYVIFTRSDLVARDDYMLLLDKDLAAVQFSISGNNNKLTRKLEPGAPSYKKRLRALSKLGDNGIWTTVRINPLFPLYPDGYYSDPDGIKARFGSRSNVPHLPLWDKEFVPELADAGVPSILAGFVRLSPFAIKNMTAASGIDIRSFFRPEVLSGRGDKRFTDKEIGHYYSMILKQCREHEVRFSTCYIGNGIKDYGQYQDLWTNKKDCCDILGNVAEFKATSQAVPWDVRIKHAPCKQSAAKSKEEEVLFDSKFVLPATEKTRDARV